MIGKVYLHELKKYIYKDFCNENTERTSAFGYHRSLVLDTGTKCRYEEFLFFFFVSFFFFFFCKQCSHKETSYKLLVKYHSSGNILFGLFQFWLYGAGCGHACITGSTKGNVDAPRFIRDFKRTSIIDDRDDANYRFPDIVVSSGRGRDTASRSNKETNQQTYDIDWPSF